jgi:hypothetical protein
MKKAFLIFAVLSATASLNAQVDLQQLATVKYGTTESITVKELKQRVQMYSKQSGIAKFTIDQKKEILDVMIDEKLVLQAAAKAGISVTDAQVNQYFIQNISQQVGQVITEAQFADLIKENTGKTLDAYMQEQTGLTVKEFKANLKNQLTAQQYLVSQNQDALKGQAATDKEVRDFFATNQSKFTQSETYKILLLVAPKGQDSTGAKQQLTDVYDATKGKTGAANLDALKKTYGTPGPNKIIQAGELFIPRSSETAQALGMSQDDINQLFSRAPGWMSEIIETSNDYQFYVTREKYPAKLLALTDVVQPDSTMTVYEYLSGMLGQQKQAQYLAQAVKDLTAKLRTPQNFEMKKKDAALDKLLDWS